MRGSYLCEAPAVFLLRPGAPVDLRRSSASVLAWFRALVLEVGVLEGVEVPGRRDRRGEGRAVLPVGVQRPGPVQGSGKRRSYSVGAGEGRDGRGRGRDRVPVEAVAAPRRRRWRGATHGVRGRGSEDGLGQRPVEVARRVASRGGRRLLRR